MRARYPHADLAVGRPVEGLRVRRARALPKEAPVVQRRHPRNGRRRARGRLVARALTRDDKLRDQRIVVFGAGAGGAGVAWALVRGMMREGLTEKEAMERMFLLDSKGLLAEDRPMEDYKTPVREAAKTSTREGWGRRLLEVVERAKATCAARALRSARHVHRSRSCARWRKNTERPIVFALSNPTTSCEAQPADILAWTARSRDRRDGQPVRARQLRRQALRDRTRQQRVHLSGSRASAPSSRKRARSPTAW